MQNINKDEIRNILGRLTSLCFKFHFVDFEKSSKEVKEFVIDETLFSDIDINAITEAKMREISINWFFSLYRRGTSIMDVIKENPHEYLNAFLPPQKDMFGGYIPDWIVDKKYVTFVDKTCFVGQANIYGEALCNIAEDYSHQWKDISSSLEKRGIYKFSSPEMELLCNAGLNNLPPWFRASNKLSRDDLAKWREEKLIELHNLCRSIEITKLEKKFLDQYKNEIANV